MYDNLYRWYEVRQQLDRIKEEERELRDAVVNEFFAELDTGTERIDVPGDATLVCTRSMNYRLDETALEEALKAVPKTKKDKLVRWKPSLDKRTYDSLSAKAKQGFDEAVIATPGAPSIKLELPEAESE